MWTMIPFKFRNDPPHVYALVRQWMDDFRRDEGKSTKVGAVGFCWGGYHVTKLAAGELAADGTPIIDAAFTAHPSELKLPDDIQHVTIPYSVSIGDVDFAMPMKDVERMEQILGAASNVDSEVVVIPGAKHGFAVRANPEDKAAMSMADQAFEQATNWFKKHLASSKS
jgi:dienelactone hydrolase